MVAGIFFTKHEKLIFWFVTIFIEFRYYKNLLGRSMLKPVLYKGMSFTLYQNSAYFFQELKKQFINLFTCALVIYTRLLLTIIPRLQLLQPVLRIHFILMRIRILPQTKWIRIQAQNNSLRLTDFFNMKDVQFCFFFSVIFSGTI